MKTKNQSGFTAIIAFMLAAAIVGVAVFAAYRVMSKDDNTLADEYSSVSAGADKATGVIKSAEELQKTAESIDAADIDKDLDTSELDEDIDAIF